MQTAQQKTPPAIPQDSLVFFGGRDVFCRVLVGKLKTSREALKMTNDQLDRLAGLGASARTIELPKEILKKVHLVHSGHPGELRGSAEFEKEPSRLTGREFNRAARVLSVALDANDLLLSRDKVFIESGTKFLKLKNKGRILATTGGGPDKVAPDEATPVLLLLAALRELDV